MALSLAQRAELHAPAGAPLVEVEHIARVITTRTQTTTILDDLTFTVPAQSLFRHQRPIRQRQIHAAQPADWHRPAHQREDRLLWLRDAQDRARTRWPAGAASMSAIVFQFFQLLPTLTAQENVLLALELGGVASFRARSGGRAPMRRLRLVG